MERKCVLCTTRDVCKKHGVKTNLHEKHSDLINYTKNQINELQMTTHLPANIFRA